MRDSRDFAASTVDITSVKPLNGQYIDGCALAVGTRVKASNPGGNTIFGTLKGFNPRGYAFVEWEAANVIFGTTKTYTGSFRTVEAA